MFASEGMVITNVLNIFFKKLALEIILRTLPILKDLIKVVEVPKLELVNKVIMTLANVLRTTKKSKTFHPLRK